MKTITIRDLHAKTGYWVREAAQHGEIRITDNGEPVATIVATPPPRRRPYFASPKRSRRFLQLEAAGKLRGGTDSTIGISADREDREM